MYILGTNNNKIVMYMDYSLKALKHVYIMYTVYDLIDLGKIISIFRVLLSKW